MVLIKIKDNLHLVEEAEATEVVHITIKVVILIQVEVHGEEADIIMELLLLVNRKVEVYMEEEHLVIRHQE